MRCGYCGTNRHTTDYCPKTAGGQAKRNELRCSYCGERNHNRDACRKCWPGPNPIATDKNGVKYTLC